MKCPVCKSEDVRPKYRNFGINSVIGAPPQIDCYYCNDCGVMLINNEKIIQKRKVPVANRSGRTQSEDLLVSPNGQRKLTCKNRRVHEQDALPNKSQDVICPFCYGTGMWGTRSWESPIGECKSCGGTGQTTSVR